MSGGLPRDRVLVVAELGNTHEGDPERARAMVRAAAAAGADGVKLQVFRAEEFVRPQQPERLAQLRGYQLPDEVVCELCALGRELGLLVIATPLDRPSLHLVAPLVDALKIASGDNDHLPFIREVAAAGPPVVISTGLADLGVVRDAVDAVRAVDATREVWLLQCTSAYPAMPEEAHLAAIATLRDALGVPVGYSDHTIGVEVPVLAVAAGAKMIEKHLTLNHRVSEFRDHLIAADPAELAALVARVRWAERVMGVSQKRPDPAEAPLHTLARRSPVAARDLPAGTVLTADDITHMRPRDGLLPEQAAGLVGSVVAHDTPRGAPLG